MSTLGSYVHGKSVKYNRQIGVCEEDHILISIVISPKYRFCNYIMIGFHIKFN